MNSGGDREKSICLLADEKKRGKGTCSQQRKGIPSAKVAFRKSTAKGGTCAKQEKGNFLGLNKKEGKASQRRKNRGKKGGLFIAGGEGEEET